MKAHEVENHNTKISVKERSYAEYDMHIDWYYEQINGDIMPSRRAELMSKARQKDLKYDIEAEVIE